MGPDQRVGESQSAAELVARPGLDVHLSVRPAYERIAHPRLPQHWLPALHSSDRRGGRPALGAMGGFQKSGVRYSHESGRRARLTACKTTLPIYGNVVSILNILWVR